MLSLIGEVNVSRHQPPPRLILKLNLLLVRRGHVLNCCLSVKINFKPNLLTPLNVLISKLL